MTFETRPGSPLLRAIADAGYTTPHPSRLKPSRRPPGRRPAGRRANRHRQDGRLHSAHAAPPGAAALPLQGQSRAATPSCLILTPTRELAAQVEESAHLRYRPDRHGDVGGVGMQPQIDRLRRCVDIRRRHAGPPARPPSAKARSTCSHVEIFVLDEADRMLTWASSTTSRRCSPLLQPSEPALFRPPATRSALAERPPNQPRSSEGGRAANTADTIRQNPPGRPR